MTDRLVYSFGYLGRHVVISSLVREHYLNDTGRTSADCVLFASVVAAAEFANSQIAPDLSKLCEILCRVTYLPTGYIAAIA